MLPYILLIFIPFLFCFIAFEKKGNIKIIGYVGNNEYIRTHNLAILGFFIGLFILLACRGITVGNDTANYNYYFDIFRKQTFLNLLNEKTDVLYSVLCWFVGRFTDDFQWQLAVTSAITVIPIASLYNEEREHSYLKIILFVNMSTFIMMFSGIRQSIAFSVGMLAYRFVRKKKLIAFLICVAIAYGFHQSAFIILFMYPVYHFTLKKKHLLFIIPLILLVFVFNESIFNFLFGVLSRISSRYSEITMSETGAVTTFILFVLFAVLSYLIPDETKINKEIMGLRNFLLLSVVLQSFASLHTLAMRMNYYYILFIPILIPKILSIPSERYKQVARLAELVLCVFFTAYFLYSVYSANATGGALNTVPYIPFWSE